MIINMAITYRDVSGEELLKLLREGERDLRFIRTPDNTNLCNSDQYPATLEELRKNSNPIQLTDSRLVGLTAHGIYLPDANLERAILEEASLVGANLGGAYLRRAYLVGANLDRASLVGADLSYTAGTITESYGLTEADVYNLVVEDSETREAIQKLMEQKKLFAD